MIGPFAERDAAAARAAFRWPALGRFNIAEACAAHWASRAPERSALLHLDAESRLDVWSYGRLDRAAARFANALLARGVHAGDRVAVLLPQAPAALVAHLGVYKLGAVATPLFAPFGADAIAFRLEDSGARAVVTDAAGAAKLAEIGADDLLVFSTDGDAGGAVDFFGALDAAGDAFPAAETDAEGPAFLCYTSGTTGSPKGALHAHRALVGHLPAIQAWTMGLGSAARDRPAGDVLWTPADWAWLGGLCNLLLPALYYGAAVLSAPMRPFDPERALALCRRFGVTRAFLPPTALRVMRAADLRAAPDLRLRAIGAAGEPVGAAVAEWAEAALGAPVNEFYGQTECNGVLGWSARFGPKPAGALGRALPGFEVAIRDDAGRVLARDATGELLVRAPAPTLMLGYWARPDATAERVRDGWLLTGDRVSADGDGVIRFEGRVDDVINSAGYRIGPSEIEDCLARHPAVAACGVVGAPDPVRGETVAAFVVLRDHARSEDEESLRAALVAHARARLGGYAAPRRLDFVTSLPTTETGKIRRRDLRARLAATS